MDLVEYHFHLKTLTGNFLLEWRSESSESTKNRKKAKAVVARTTQLRQQEWKKEIEEKKEIIKKRVRRELFEKKKFIERLSI